jgi:S-adenosyl methyltransferase
VTDERWLRETARSIRRPRIDASVPNVSRVWNYLTGGRDNFDADRKAARQLIKASPAMGQAGYAVRAFLGRVTRYLADEAGMRQFLDIGTGMPAPGGVHDVAQSVAPESRIVCVDNDPIVLSHARALLRPAPRGATSFVDADVREPGTIIKEAGATLDFGEPVAVVIKHLLNYVGRDAEVRSILATLMDAVCPGSHLVVVHSANDLGESLADAARRWNKLSTTQVVPRGRPEITAWFDGLDMVDPGVVAVTDWRPGPPDGTHDADGTDDGDGGHDAQGPHDGVIPMYGIVGRKPAV